APEQLGVRITPVTFSCEETFDLAPDEIVRQILDTSKWPDFKGYVFLPGIKKAEFEIRTASILGSRIRVTNTDGSSHIEEIVEWQSDDRRTLLMKFFSPPLSGFATHFDESWDFTPCETSTKVVRRFKLHAKSSLSRLVLLAISWMLKKAIARHMRQL